MRKIILFICIYISMFQVFAQTSNSEIYRILKHHTEGSRTGSEDIILYKDGTFCVETAIGYISVTYSGGWWVDDTLLVLFPSQNCNGPLLLDKIEIRDRNSKDLSIEIYNEKGILKYWGHSDNQGKLTTIKNNGCVIMDVKEGILFRYFHFAFKGRTIHVKTRKCNNKVVYVVLEPIRSDDVYLGKQTIPFCELEEDNDNPLYKQ